MLKKVKFESVEAGLFSRTEAKAITAVQAQHKPAASKGGLRDGLQVRGHYSPFEHRTQSVVVDIQSMARQHAVASDQA